MKERRMNDYDEENIFNKILNKTIKCVNIDEDENNLTFEELNKQAQVHILTKQKNK